MIDPAAVSAHRARGLDPDRPELRGSAQNPDVFFQAREACNPFHDRVPGAVQASMDVLAERTGRQYHLVDYHGAPDADRVIVLMGSGAGAAKETVDELCRLGERVGVAVVRLYRPFPSGRSSRRCLRARAPSWCSTARRSRARRSNRFTSTCCRHCGTRRRATGATAATPRVIGGRYGLSSKEFTPAMVKAVFDEAAAEHTAQRIHGRDHRRCHPHQPHVRPCVLDRQRSGTSRVLRARCRRHGRGEQEHGEDRRQEQRPVRAGLLRLRLEEVGLDDGEPSPLRPATDREHLPDRPGDVRRRAPVELPRPNRRAWASPLPARPC